MAVSAAAQAGSAAGATTASSRRAVYGLNVALSAVIAVVVVAFAVMLAGRFKGQVDLTQSGSNSLSPRTRQMVANLKEDVTITAFYAVLSDIQKFAQKRKDTVKDLIDLYEAAGRGKVTGKIVDPMRETAQIPAILARLREKPAYKDEAKPHETALAKFPELEKRIADVTKADADAMKNFAATSERLKSSREFLIVFTNLQRVARDMKALSDEVAELQQGDVPRYGRAVELMRDSLTKTRTMLQDCYGWMSGDALSMPELSPAVAEFFRGVPERYEKLIADLGALLKDTENLKKVKLEETFETLSRATQSPPILVETKEEARVLSMDDVWPYRQDPRATPADGDPLDFAGEQAISSAILQLTQKEKTGIVFTRYGGESPIKPDFSKVQMTMQLPRAPFGQLNDQLTKANFVTQDWDVQTQKTPPVVEGAKRLIYVVFPPEPPQQPNPMQPSRAPNITPTDKKAITDAVEASGMAIFLTGWERTNPMNPMGSGSYEFADYLKSSWGVDVKYSFIALHFTPSPDKTGLWRLGQDGQILTSPDVLRFSNHPITAPLMAQTGAFPLSAPLQLVSGDAKPAGVTLETLITAAESKDVWATSDIFRLQDDLQKRMGTRPGNEDIVAPFPIAVAGSNDKKQKVVLIASEQFAADDVAQATQATLGPQGLQLYTAYPANSDLFLNALHWLTGDADRIAIGPRKADVPRLDKLTEGPAATFWRVFLVAIWPAVALLAGGGMWLLRRR